MTHLRLRIISEHRRLLRERSSITFGADGGTIGRSADNDWILPDPQRYISAHHARVTFAQGQFVLEDTSTNGVFVNDEEQPVRERGPYRLRSGDVLRLGEYQVVVALESETPELAVAGVPAVASRAGALHASASAAVADAVPTHIDVLESFGRAAQTDLGAALDLDELLRTDSTSGNRIRPVNAYGQAVLPQQASAGASPIAAGAAAAAGHAAGSGHVDAPVHANASGHLPADGEEPDDQAIARRIERLARAAARAREPRGPSPPAPLDVQNGLQAFCRGAGIDPTRLPADAHTQLLHLVGQLLREALVGLKDLERARDESREHFRIEVQADPDDPRPSLVRSTVEELLVELLGQHESRRLDAVQWLREGIETAKTHERATSEALRAAFAEFIGRFDPAELEARFERTLRRGGAPSRGDPRAGTPPADSGDSRYWQLFVEFYRNLTEMPADRMPHTFVEAFATAYKRAVQTSRSS